MNNSFLEKKYYAPWNLKGDGYIILYKLPLDFLKENGFIDNYFQDKIFGGLSALMIIDYHDSNVGAYQEILFIPSLFNFRKRKLFSISKIYVNSDLSLINGYENWAIPKEYANFEFNQIEDKSEIVISKDKNTFFSAKLKSSFLKIPFTNSFFPLSLVQHRNDKTFITDFYASGKISMADVEISFIDKKYLPQLNKFKPVISLKMNDFKMVFKEAKVFDY